VRPPKGIFLVEYLLFKFLILLDLCLGFLFYGPSGYEHNDTKEITREKEINRRREKLQEFTEGVWSFAEMI